MDGFKDQQIKRTKTAGTVANKAKKAELNINPANLDMIAGERKSVGKPSVNAQNIGKNIKKPNPATAKLKTEAVNKVPEIKNVKKAEKKAKPLTPKQIAARAKAIKKKETGDKISELHTLLDAQVAEMFEGYRGSDGIPDTMDYENVKESDKNKRIKEAIKRESYAEQIYQYEESQGDSPEIIRGDVRDKEELKRKINEFMELTSKELDIDTDEKFVNNLAENYERCLKAETVKKMLDEAIEGGYLPDDMDTESVLNRAAGYEELKFYMDNRKELMKSKYYKYFSSEDVAYTDNQIGHMIQKLESSKNNEELLSYLRCVKTLRAQGFDRKKGIKSESKKITKKAKDQDEILKTKHEKRMLIEKMTDNALNFRESPAFREKDYDSRYTRELFMRKLAEFNKLKVTDLHMGSVRDLTEHFDENARMFEQAREFENFLFMAARLDSMEVSDNDMIKLRAKIRVFSDAEKMAYWVQEIILLHPEEAVNDLTYADIEKRAADNAYRSKWSSRDDGPDLKLGMNLNKHFEAINRMFKQEHADRKEHIRRIYGLMHPVNAEGEDGEEHLVPGEISEEELNKRAADYQKNALFNEHIINGHQYLAGVWNRKMNCFREAYLKRTGIDAANAMKPERSLSAYTAGMSSKEYMKLVNLLDHGTEEEKEKFFKSMIKEAEDLDPKVFDLSDGNKTMGNIFFKYARNGFMGNFEDFANYLKDPEDQAKAKAYHGVGCGFYVDLQNVAQKYIATGKYARAVMTEEMFKYFNTYEQFSSDCDEHMDDNDEYVQNGFTYINKDEWYGLGQIMSGPQFASSSRVPLRYRGLPDQSEYEVTPQVSKYEEFVRFGVWKKTSKEDLATIKKFMSGHTGEKAVKTEMITFAKDLSKQVPEAGAPDESIRRYCADAEKVFAKIMSLDPADFSFKTYKDIISDEKKFNTCAEGISLAESAAGLLEHYRTFYENRGEKKYGKVLKLNREYIKEIEARIDLLKCAKPFFDGEFASLCDSEVLGEFDSIDDMLHQPDKIYLDKIAQAKQNKKTKDAEAIEKIREFIKKLDGFDVHTPLNVLEKRYRTKHGIRNDRNSTPKEVANILNGTKSVFKSKNAGKIKIKVAGEEFFRESLKGYFAEQELTVRDREKLLVKKDSQQFIKNNNKETLITSGMAVRNSLYGIKNKLSNDIRMIAGEETLNSLIPFMKTDDLKYNEELIRKYSDVKTRDSVIDEMTKSIMAVNVDLNLASDAAFAKSAQTLEYITRVAYGYREILRANPGYIDRLKNRQSGASKNDHRMVTERLNRLFAISDYYRARKLLVTNSYYILHENSELSMDKKSARNEEQRKIAELYALVNKCADRISDAAYEERENDDMEQILSDLEAKAAREAFMTGRVDMNAMSVSKLKKTHSNLSKFLAETQLEGEEEQGINSANIHKIQEGIDDKNAFPDMKKTLTPEVREILKASLVDFGMNRKLRGPVKTSLIFTDRQQKLKDRLDKFLTIKEAEKDEKTNAIKKPAVMHTSFTLANPKNKDEVYSFKTSPVRLMGDIVFLLGDEASEDEIIDIFDGLLIGSKGGLDLNDEKQWAYAKDRWIKSVKKLYDLESAAMFKYEQTYGSLIGQVPVGSFVQSLGNGLVQFHTRSRFAGQNVLELCDEQEIKTGDGKEISVGELLVKEGLLSKSDNERCRMLAGSYQQKSSYVTTYYRGLFGNFGDGDNYDSDYGTTYGETQNWLYTDSNSPIEGPRMSKAMRRKLWKEAQASQDKNILGGNLVVAVNKPVLNLYSSSERKEMKKQRAKDLQIAKFAAGYMDTRAEDLYDETIKAINGEDLPEETKTLIRDTLVNFHPAMYQSGKIEKKQENGKEVRREAKVKGTDEFYENVKKFLGMGVNEGDRIKAKREAFMEFSKLSKLFIMYPATMNDPEDIMSKDGVRESDHNVINGTNALLKLEARHRMHVAIQDLASGPDVKTWLDQNSHKDYRSDLKTHLRTEMIYALMRSDFYLNMKDIENPGKTLTERNYELLRNIGVFKVDKMYLDLDRDILTDEAMIALNEFGIRIDAPIYEEVKPVEVPVAKKENKSKKADEKAEADKKAGAATEKEKTAEAKEKEKASTAKEKKKAEAEKNLNVINIINEEEEEAPAVMAPVFEGLQYDHQGATQYCWACTLAGLMNAYAGKQITNLATITKQSSRLKAPSYAKSGFTDEAAYQTAVEFAKDMYSGAKTGNPSLVGDYVHKVLPNTAIRSVMIGVERGKTEQSEAEFKRIASEQIKKGPFGILHNGHYVLVRGIRGDRLLVNNSLSADPSEVAPYDYKISQIFSVGEDDPKIKQIEMVWLQDMKGSEQAIADEFKFAYDAKTGEFKVDNTKKKDSQGKSKETILHKDGIEGSYVSANEIVAQQIYIPKFMLKQAGAEEPQVEQPVEQNIIQPVLQAVEEPKIKEPVEKKTEEKAKEKAKEKTEEKKDEKKEEKIVEKKEEKTEEKKAENKEEDPYEAGCREELKKIDELYDGSGIPQNDLKHVKEAAEAKWNFTKRVNHALPEKENKELEKTQSGFAFGYDPRGLKVLLRPVNVDKNGEPLTEEDKKNRELNLRDYESYKQLNISKRKPHLDYVVEDIIKNMFTLEQLGDPEFIRANKDKAIRFVSLMHYIGDHLRGHWKYYLTQADPKIRVFAFLFRGTFFSDLVTGSINNALYGYGYGNAILGSSSQHANTIPYRKGDDYKSIKKENDNMAGKSSYYVMATLTTYEALYSGDKNMPFTEQGQKMIEDAREDDYNMMNSFSAPLQYQLTKKLGKKKDRDQIDNELIMQLSAEKMSEFFKKKDDKKYLKSMLKEIKEYMKLYEPNPENASSLKDDLK